MGCCPFNWRCLTTFPFQNHKLWSKCNLLLFFLLFFYVLIYLCIFTILPQHFLCSDNWILYNFQSGVAFTLSIFVLKCHRWSLLDLCHLMWQAYLVHYKERATWWRLYCQSNIGHFLWYSFSLRLLVIGI